MANSTLKTIVIYLPTEVLSFLLAQYLCPRTRSPIDASAISSLLATATFFVVTGLFERFNGWMFIAFPFAWFFNFPCAWLGTVWYRPKRKKAV